METSTDLGYHTAALGYCTANCTALGSLGILNSNQLSRIRYSDASTTSTVFFTGNAPENIVTHSCYMAEISDPKSDSDSRKGGKIVFSTLFQIRI